MNLSEKSAYNYFIYIIKLAPIIIMGVLMATQQVTLVQFTEYLPNFSFTETLTSYLSTIGITLGDVGTFAVRYFNYLVMVTLVEIVFNVFAFIPDLFKDFLARFKR